MKDDTIIYAIIDKKTNIMNKNTFKDIQSAIEFIKYDYFDNYPNEELTYDYLDIIDNDYDVLDPLCIVFDKNGEEFQIKPLTLINKFKGYTWYDAYSMYDDIPLENNNILNNKEDNPFTKIYAKTNE